MYRKELLCWPANTLVSLLLIVSLKRGETLDDTKTFQSLYCHCLRALISWKPHENHPIILPAVVLRGASFSGGVQPGEQQQSDANPASSAILFGFGEAGGSSSSSLLLSYGLLQSPYKQMWALKYDVGLRVNIWGRTRPFSVPLTHTPGLDRTDVCVCTSHLSPITCHHTASLHPPPPRASFLCLSSLSLSFLCSLALWSFSSHPAKPYMHPGSN